MVNSPMNMGLFLLMVGLTYMGNHSSNFNFQHPNFVKINSQMFSREGGTSRSLQLLFYIEFLTKNPEKFWDFLAGEKKQKTMEYR